MTLMLLVCVASGCTTEIDLSKEVAAFGAACAHDTPAPPLTVVASSPFVQIDRIVDLSDSLEATSIATEDELAWVLARDNETVTYFLVAIDSAGMEFHRWPIPGWPWSLHVADGHAITQDLRDRTTLRIDLASGEVRRFARLPGEPDALTVSSDGLRAYQTLSTTAEIAVLDVSSGQQACRLPVVSGVRSAIALSRDGVRLFVGYGGGGGSLYHAGIEVLDRATGRTLGLVSTGVEISDLDLSPDESRLAALAGRRLVTIDPTTMTELLSTPLPDQGDGITWHDEHAYVWSFATKAIWVVDPLEGRLVATVSLPVRPNGLAIGSDFAYVSGDRLIVLRRSPGGTPRAT